MKKSKSIRLKQMIISLLPSIFFLSALLFLTYSPLTISKLVTIQNDVIIVFLGHLKQTDLSSSLSQTFSYLWSNLLSSIVVFLAIVCIAFIIDILFLDKIDFRVSLASNIMVVFMIFVLTNFSTVMLLTSIGLVLGTVWVQKTFERKKNDFSTGYSFVKSKLRIMNLFLAIGIFLAILANIQSYEKQIYESNVKMISGFIPEVTDLRKLQKTQIQEIIGGIESALNEQYQQVSSDTERQCKSVYDGIIQGLDNYENQALQQIEEQELGISKGEILEYFPFFDVIVEATPLFTALVAYIVLGFLTPIMSIVSGIIYSMLRKVKRLETFL